MRLFTTIILLLCSCIGYTQTNLLLNPGFEDDSLNQRGVNELRAEGYLTNHWYNPLKKRSPHFYVKPRKSVAKAHSGVGAVGLVLGSVRHEKTKFEYLTGELKAPLKKDQVYCVCFYSLLHRTSRWAGTDIGILFHHDQKLISGLDEPQTYTANLYLNDGAPVTDTKWQKFCGYYLATGGEKYMSFGKFGDKKSTRMSDLELEAYFEIDAFQTKAYYQFDDFSVREINDSTDCDCAKDLPEVVEEDKDSISTKDHTPYLFALDVSGSMKKNALFDSLRGSMKNLVSVLPHGTPISFVTFSSNSRYIYTGKVSENTHLEVDSLLAGVALGGGTNVYSGLEKAYRTIKPNGKDSARMILISDGAFTVTTKIEDIVREQFENYGRRVTIVQVESKVKGLERLDPYQTSYVHTTPSELNQAISTLYRPQSGSYGVAYGCACSEIFSDTMNYHFVVDYSGSMKNEKSRAVEGVKYLFERAPDDAAISITIFNSSSREIYVGRKSDITMRELTQKLNGINTGGGTNPAPGVRRALNIARKMDENRFSHLILVTDLKANSLTTNSELYSALNSSRDMYIAVSSMTVDKGGILVNHSQYDFTTNEFLDVNRQKFETDLFYTERSSCDFTSQAYHFNPVADMLKKGAKRQLNNILRQVMEQRVRIPQ